MPKPKAYLETIKSILQYLNISDCKMQEGSIRCDVNVSIMRPEDKELGTRAEIKKHELSEIDYPCHQL